MPEVQVFRATTPRSAVFRIKRWVYARFYTPAVMAGRKDLAEKNKEAWTKLASRMIEALSRVSSDALVRIHLVFDSKVHGYVGGGRRGPFKIEEFIPLDVKLEIYEKRMEEVLSFVSRA